MLRRLPTRMCIGDTHGTGTQLSGLMTDSLRGLVAKLLLVVSPWSPQCRPMVLPMGPGCLVWEEQQEMLEPALLLSGQPLRGLSLHCGRPSVKLVVVLGMTTMSVLRGSP